MRKKLLRRLLTTAYLSLALATLIFCATLFAFKLDIDEQNAKEQRPAATQHTYDEVADKEPRVLGVGAEGWTAIFTGVLAVFTMGLAGVTYWLFIVTKKGLAEQERLTRASVVHAERSAKAAESAIVNANQSSEMQLRAYLSIVKHEIKETKDAIIITVRNCGHTPAKKVACRNNFQWHPPEGSMPEGFDWPDYPNSYSAVNGYWGPLQELPVTFSVDPNRLEQVHLGKIVLYMYGHVDYEDWFGNPRQLKFCYQGVSLNNGRAAFRMYEAHNEGN